MKKINSYQIFTESKSDYDTALEWWSKLGGHKQNKIKKRFGHDGNTGEDISVIHYLYKEREKLPVPTLETAKPSKSLFELNDKIYVFEGTYFLYKTDDIKEFVPCEAKDANVVKGKFNMRHYLIAPDRIEFLPEEEHWDDDYTERFKTSFQRSINKFVSKLAFLKSLKPDLSKEEFREVRSKWN